MSDTPAHPAPNPQSPAPTNAPSPTRTILQLAWPMLIAQVAVMANGVIDTVMAGHYSARALAVVGLGTSVYFSIFVALMGLLMALSPILSHLQGAGDSAGVARESRQGVWLACAASGIAVVALLFPQPFFAIAKMEPAMEADVRAYLKALVFAAPAMLLFRVFYCLATAIAQPKAVMAIQLAGLALKVPLNYVLMYGKFGLPELGGVGCAWALVIESWLMIVAAYAWVRLAPQFRALWVFAGPWRIDWASQRAMVALGAPIGGAILIDVTSYTFMALFIARLGEDTSAAHQIAANVGALAYMVPLALSNAAGVVVGHALGAGQLAQARALGITGLRIGLGAALLVACVIALNTAWIAAAYAKDSAVRTVAALLLPFVAAFHIGDACNAMASNIARAYKKTVVPMLVFALALWVVGLGGGYLLAYGPSPFALLGARGFWAGAVTGMSLAAIGVTVYTLMVMRHDVLATSATTQDATPPGPPAAPPKSPATN